MPRYQLAGARGRQGTTTVATVLAALYRRGCGRGPAHADSPEVRVDGQRRVAPSTVADASGDLREGHAGAEQRGDHEMSQRVKVNLPGPRRSSHASG